MIGTPVSTIVDVDLCVGCGTCESVCPTGTISVDGETAVVTGDLCLNCAHCAAACPQGAVEVGSISKEMSDYSTFNSDTRWLPAGEFDIRQLVRLMASRRSCRNYQDKAVDLSLLNDLIKIGTLAPSGTNSQAWTFTILPTRKAVVAMVERLVGFVEGLNKTAQKGWLRASMKLLGKPQLDVYYHQFFEHAAELVRDWRKHGRDRFLHGATAALVIAAKPGGMNPREDAYVATQNILLAAHSAGLGSCIIGMAATAMARDRNLVRFLGIPDDEEVQAVIALGYPDEVYQTLTGRREATVHYFEG
ncbi:nitroreductase family protein [Thermodesulfobacteriota bacterium]